MKNIQAIVILFALVGVSLASAYYDRYGVWHDNVVSEALDTMTGGRYSDAPRDREERKKAEWAKEDKEKKAQREYQDKQAKIQRKKEDRRYRY